MATKPIWTGISTYTTGSTPFGFYDNDVSFINEADKVAKWCATRLGYPLVNVELQSGSFYTAFEEAITVYGNEIYQWKIRENYLSLEGNSTGSVLNNQLITPSLGSLIRIAKTYGTEAGSGGTVTYRTGSIDMIAGKQDYDLKAWASGSGITGSIEIKKVFHEAPPAIVRYFDPYAGTGTGVQSLMETFGFGGMSPGINFMLMPIFFDVMKIQAIEFNDQIRKSAFSFDLVDNQLRIFPIPSLDARLYFHYIHTDERDSVIQDPRINLITNISNVPYQNPSYGQINAIGKQWIYQYTLAIAKEMLGYVRKKYSAIPIPGAEVQLNGDQLINDAQREKDALLLQFRETLDQTSRKNQLEKQMLESQYLRDSVNQVPLMIYVF